MGRSVQAGLLVAWVSAALGSEEPAPVRAALPDPLVLQSGARVQSAREWSEKRRPELLALFQSEMYGPIPPAPSLPPALAQVRGRVILEKPGLFGGKARLKLVAIETGGEGFPVIDLLLVLPNNRGTEKRERPVPVFLAMNFCGNHALVEDSEVPLPQGWLYPSCRGVTDNHATAAGRGGQAADWAIEQTIDRGYALASFCSADVDPDRAESADGLHRALRKKAGLQGAPEPSHRGSIAAWAWGFHRCVDHLVTDAALDAKRIIALGHSRNGKTALLAAAFDPRIALAIPHQAGCGGTAPSRGTVGESVRAINDRFPHWFGSGFKKYNENPGALPFDQHSLVALVAPRPVLFSNAVEDSWANPAGQLDVLRAADPVYRLLGVEGIAIREMPPPGKLVATRLGYFIRAGSHSMIPEDWRAFLDFADAQLGKP